MSKPSDRTKQSPGALDPKLRDLGRLTLAEGKAQQWVHLLRAGEFRHDEFGDFEVSADHLRAMKRNFDEKVRGYEDGKLPLDYFHESDKAAAGWIEKVELREDDSELWCFVGWTTRAAQMIADGELRYLSAEFTFDYTPNEGDEKSYGAVLFGGGVTNRPFVKGMEAVAQFAERQRNTGATPKEIKMTEAQIKELQDKLAASEARATAAEEIAKTAKAEKEAAEGIAKTAGETAALAEKNGQFNKLMLSGKAVEAQRAAFIANDPLKFAELAVQTNTGAAGSGESKKSDEKAGDCEDEILALAEAKRKADPSMKYAAAVRAVLAEKPELRAAYEKKTNVRIIA